MTIRKATIADLNAISTLNRTLFQHEQQFTDSYSLEWTFSQPGQDYFTKSITGEHGIVFVAQESESIVGYICGYIGTFLYRQNPTMAEIDNMVVEESARGKGVGSNLIKTFETEAKHRGAKRIKISALIANTRAHGFYTKSGFHQHELVFEKDL